MKDEKTATIWEKLLQWLRGETDSLSLPQAQLPKSGTNTEILLSTAEKKELQDAIVSPSERESESDTSMVCRHSASGNGDDKSLII